MGLPLDDFTAALRALATRSATVKDVLHAFRTQVARRDKGQKSAIAQVLADEKGLDAAALSGPVPDLTPIAADVRELGEGLLAGEYLSELELDRLIDTVTARPHPKTLPAVPAPSLPGYDLEWEVGRGRTGAVYRAMREGDPPVAALKTYRAEAFASDAERSAFLERAKAAAAAPPVPGFVRMLDAGEKDGRAWVAAEFIEGPTVASLVADHKIGLRHGFEVLEKAARAVGTLHAQGKAHGGIVASGILLTPDDRPHVSGLGLAAGGSVADDVLALGRVLYEIATGVPPFGGFRREKLKPPSSLNPAAAGGAEKILFKALAADPSRRYSNATDLADDLGRFLRHEEVKADVGASETQRAVAASPKRSKAPLISALIAAALILLTVWLSTRGGGTPSGPNPEAHGLSPTPRASSAPVPPTASRTPRPPPVRSDPEREALAAKGPMRRSEELDLRFKGAGALAERDFVKLEKIADEALLRGPERDWAHMFMAYAVRDRGDLDAALKHVTRAQDMGSEEPDLARLRRELLLLRGEFRRVLADIEKTYPGGVSQVNDEIRKLGEAVKAEPRNPRLYMERGALYHHRNLLDQALADFQVALDCGESRATYFIALTLWADDRRAEAIEALKRFLAAHGSGPAGDEARATLEELTRSK